MTAPANQQIALLRKLIKIGEQIGESRMLQVPDTTLRALKAEVQTERLRIGDDDNLIGYEATCLMECISELVWARSETNEKRETRALMYVNCFLGFMRDDLNLAERAHMVAR